MQKCPNWNILSPSGVQVWDVLVIQGELRSKNGIKQNVDKKVLEFNFREGLFFAQMLNSKFFYLTQHWSSMLGVP